MACGSSLDKPCLFLSRFGRPATFEMDYEGDNLQYIADLVKKGSTKPNPPRNGWSCEGLYQPNMNYSKQYSPRNVLFRVDANHFLPSQMDIKIAGRYVVIHARHPEQVDEHGLVTREFTRRYKLPEDIDAETVEATCDRRGILAIHANKVKSPEDEDLRVISMKLVHCTMGV